MKRALVACAVLTAAIFVIGVPAALSAPGDSGQACSNPANGIPPFCTDLPRGLWCNTLGILTLPGGFMVAPLNAVDLVIIRARPWRRPVSFRLRTGPQASARSA